MHFRNNISIELRYVTRYSYLIIAHISIVVDLTSVLGDLIIDIQYNHNYNITLKHYSIMTTYVKAFIHIETQTRRTGVTPNIKRFR